jgi:hypothetical protein
MLIFLQTIPGVIFVVDNTQGQRISFYLCYYFLIIIK